MKIIEVVTREQWDSFLSKSKDTCFFHTYIWAKILEKAFDNYKIATRIFLFNDGIEILIPMMKINTDRYGLQKRYESMPFGTYGGFLTKSNTRISPRHICQIIDYFKSIKVKSINFNPNPISNFIMDINGIETTIVYTHMLILEKGFNYIWEQYRHEQRNQIRKARKRGVKVYVKNDEEGFKDFYRIYEVTARRWGKDKPPYPFKLFKNMSEMGESKIKLWLAEVSGNVIAGILNFYYGNQVFNWAAALMKEYGSYCPNNLLHNEAIFNACEEGYLYYNFGASGNLEGVRQFKEGFATEKIDYSIYRYNNRDILSKLYHKNIDIFKKIKERIVK